MVSSLISRLQVLLWRKWLWEVVEWRCRVKMRWVTLAWFFLQFPLNGWLWLASLKRTDLTRWKGTRYPLLRGWLFNNHQLQAIISSKLFQLQAIITSKMFPLTFFLYFSYLFILTVFVFGYCENKHDFDIHIDDLMIWFHDWSRNDTFQGGVRGGRVRWESRQTVENESTQCVFEVYKL